MLDVQLISTEEIVFEGRANSLVFPGENGVFEIMPYHKPLVSRLVAGNVVIDGRLYPIRRGLVGVNRNKATIIVEK
jgi:F0F1-type ATP synthase epsilon subunit